MAESPKRTKIKPTWSDVKAKVSEFDKAGLIQLVAELYSFHKDNQSFLHARFSLGPNPLDDYKKKIAVALAPDQHGKRDGKISVADAKKAISAYSKAVGDPKGVLELRLFWCETAVPFSMDFGYRLTEQSVEILEIRPQWNDRSIIHERAIAKATFVRTQGLWKVFWMRASLKWHGYEPAPTAASIDEFLMIVEADQCGCFFG